MKMLRKKKVAHVSDEQFFNIYNQIEKRRYFITEIFLGIVCFTVTGLIIYKLI